MTELSPMDNRTVNSGVGDSLLAVAGCRVGVWPCGVTRRSLRALRWRQVLQLLRRVEAAGIRHRGHPGFTSLANAFALEHRFYFSNSNGVVLPAIKKLAGAISELGSAAAVTVESGIDAAPMLRRPNPMVVNHAHPHDLRC